MSNLGSFLNSNPASGDVVVTTERESVGFILPRSGGVLPGTVLVPFSVPNVAAGGRTQIDLQFGFNCTVGRPAVTFDGTLFGGAAASVNSVSLPTASIIGVALGALPFITTAQFMAISGAATAANNGTFPIAGTGPTAINVTNSQAVAPDANNGALGWNIQLKNFAVIAAFLNKTPIGNTADGQVVNAGSTLSLIFANQDSVVNLISGELTVVPS